MASVTDAPPRAVQAELDALSSLLDDSIPSKQLDRNLLIASWNIRAFGELTQSWSAGDGDSPKRDFHALRAIASVVSRFDVIAIQEAKSELTAMRALMSVLGEDWGMIMTDATKGTAGNAERFAFVFDRRRVNPSGLAAELVVPVEDAGVSTDAFNQQFARTPYAVSFRASGVEFILVTLHVLFGQRSAERIPELLAIANWLSDWAIWQHAWSSNLIALGDFNIDRRDDPLHAAFTSTGLAAPQDLNDAPRTIFASGQGRFYDQIAWFSDGPVPRLTLEYVRGGFVDFPAAIYPDLSRSSLSWRVSDHYPLWTEFRLP